MSNKTKISTTDGGRKSGRAVFDNQGRASWEWQTATGVFETNVTNEQLQNLEASGLALVESEPFGSLTRSAGRVRSNGCATAAGQVSPSGSPPTEIWPPR
jgi:hypothetical protein